jgi:hypothetical protein
MNKMGAGKPLAQTIHKFPCKVLIVGKLNGSWDTLTTALAKEDFELSAVPSVSKCAMKLRNFHPDVILISDTLLSEDNDLTSLYSLLRFLLIPIFIINQKPPRYISIQEVGDAGTLLVEQLNKYHSTVKKVEKALDINQAILEP